MIPTALVAASRMRALVASPAQTTEIEHNIPIQRFMGPPLLFEPVLREPDQYTPGACARKWAQTYDPTCGFRVLSGSIFATMLARETTFRVI
jgi:hypothetical protein